MMWDALYINIDDPFSKLKGLKRVISSNVSMPDSQRFSMFD